MLSEKLENLPSLTEPSISNTNATNNAGSDVKAEIIKNRYRRGLDENLTKFIDARILWRIEDALDKISSQDIIDAFAKRSISNEFSSRLIHLYPDDRWTFVFGWASKYVIDRITSHCTHDLWRNMYREIHRLRYADPKGMLFEGCVRHLLELHGHYYEIRRLDKDNQRRKKPRIDAEGESTKISENQLYKMPKPRDIKAIRNPEDMSNFSETGILFLPDKSNFPAVDAILSPNTLFQMTMSETHAINHDELVRVIKHLPAYKDGKIMLFFVVPDDIYRSLKHQPYKDNNHRVMKGEPERLKNVEQWALKIDVSAGSRNGDPWLTLKMKANTAGRREGLRPRKK
jgi:hypothetical protein